MDIAHIKIHKPADSRLKTLQCGTRLIEVILNHFGYQHIERFIGGECVFYEYRTTSAGVPRFSRRLTGAYIELEKSHGFVIHNNEFKDLESGMASLINILLSHHLNNVQIDMFYLSHTPYFSKKHQYHSIIITGMSGDSISFCDPAYDVYEGVAPLEIFKTAMFSNYGDKKKQPMFRVIDIGSPKTPLNPKKDQFIATMKQNYEDMVHPDRNRIFSQNTQIFPEQNDNRYLVGLQGLKELDKRILDAYKNGTVPELSFKLCGVFGNIVEQTELHARYLEDMGGMFNLPDIATLAGDLLRIVQEWNLVKNMFLKASIKDAPEEMIQRCMRRINALASLEGEFLAREIALIEKL